MLILIVVFVVLMMFWLFGGGYYIYNGPNPSPAAFGLGTFVPWCCVAILGIILFWKLSPPGTFS